MTEPYKKVIFSKALDVYTPSRDQPSEPPPLAWKLGKVTVYEEPQAQGLDLRATGRSWRVRGQFQVNIPYYLYLTGYTSYQLYHSIL